MTSAATALTKAARTGAAAETDEFRLDGHIFYLFSRILATRNRNLNAELGRHGLDYPRWRVMAVLNEHPGCSMLQLAEHTSVDRTTLAHTVGMMVEEQLVGREKRSSDRRSVVLALTPRGRRVLRQILPAVMKQNERALAGFSAAEADKLRAHLQRMFRNIST